MYDYLFSISSIMLFVGILAKALRIHPYVLSIGRQLEDEIWTIRSKGSVWHNHSSDYIILPNARGAKHAYVRYNGNVHECSTMETFYLRMMARKALEKRKKEKRV